MSTAVGNTSMVGDGLTVHRSIGSIEVRVRSHLDRVLRDFANLYTDGDHRPR